MIKSLIKSYAPLREIENEIHQKFLHSGLDFDFAFNFHFCILKGVISKMQTCQAKMTCYFEQINILNILNIDAKPITTYIPFENPTD